MARQKVQAKQKSRKGIGGRPTLYRPEYAQQVVGLARLGLIGPQIAEYFGVSEDTIYSWMRAHPEFAEAVKEGREKSDEKVAESLYHRARGWRHKAVKIMQNGGEVITEEYTEKYPPDVAACIFWLKNRRPDLWRDKQEVEHSGSIDISERLARALERDGDG